MILAIDPGPEESAFMKLTRDGYPSNMLCFGRRSNDAVVKFLRSVWLDKHDTVVIEEIQNQGMPIGKTTIQTAMWTGRFVQVATDIGFPVVLVGRRDIKLHWCGDMRAKDPNVRQALIDHYGPPGTKKAPGVTYGIKNDIWSTLAIAGYWHAKQNGRA